MCTVCGPCECWGVEVTMLCWCWRCAGTEYKLVWLSRAVRPFARRMKTVKMTYEELNDIIHQQSVCLVCFTHWTMPKIIIIIVCILCVRLRRHPYTIHSGPSAYLICGSLAKIRSASQLSRIRSLGSHHRLCDEINVYIFQSTIKCDDGKFMVVQEKRVKQTNLCRDS